MPDQKERTGARPQVVDGITFHCYRTGILRSKWISDDGRLQVQNNYNSSTYCASVEGAVIAGSNPMRAKRFRSMTAAMLAAVFESRRAAFMPPERTAK